MIINTYSIVVLISGAAVCMYSSADRVAGAFRMPSNPPQREVLQPTP